MKPGKMLKMIMEITFTLEKDIKDAYWITIRLQKHIEDNF